MRLELRLVEVDEVVLRHVRAGLVAHDEVVRGGGRKGEREGGGEHVDPAAHGGVATVHKGLRA